jgi:hypothetical protein
MVTMLVGLIGYLSYCIGALLMRLVIWTVYALGAAFYYVLKYGLMFLHYGFKFLWISSSLIFTKLCLIYQKSQVKAERPASYME